MYILTQNGEFVSINTGKIYFDESFTSTLCWSNNATATKSTQGTVLGSYFDDENATKELNNILRCIVDNKNIYVMKIPY